MSSVFDDPRAVLVPPTRREFEEQLGEPLVLFTIDQPDLVIPKGLLPCCRVVHQPHCDHHVAASLVGCSFSLTYPDGLTTRRAPLRQTFVGDVLSRPSELAAAVQAVWLQAGASAEVERARISTMEFRVWSLNLELAEAWRYLQQQAEAERPAFRNRPDDPGTAAIEALPLVVLAGPGATKRVARVQAEPTFRHVTSYASHVLVVPHEIGHDDRARYVTGEVWGTPDEVPPVVDAIMRDPDESERVGAA